MVAYSQIFCYWPILFHRALSNEPQSSRWPSYKGRMEVSYHDRSRSCVQPQDPHTSFVSSLKIDGVCCPSSNTPTRAVWWVAFPHNIYNYFGFWCLSLTCNSQQLCIPLMITIRTRRSREHKRTVFTVVKNDDVLFLRDEPFGKSFEFSHCVYSVLNHYLQWREFHCVT